MEDEELHEEPVVYDDIVDKRTDELTELLESRNMKQLKARMDEMQEFDVAEFLSDAVKHPAGAVNDLGADAVAA